MPYDDAKFGVITRKWFSLPIKQGGDAAQGFTFNETQSVKVARWYPRGPIQALKVGVLTVATLGKGEELFRLAVGGTAHSTSALLFATIVASTTSAPYTIASQTLTRTLTAGSYLTLMASTNVCSTGSVSVFVDYRPRYSASGKWDPTS